MKSIKIDDHKEPGHRFWSISDINRLITIDVYRFWSSIGIIDVLRPVELIVQRNGNKPIRELSKQRQEGIIEF